MMPRFRVDIDAVPVLDTVSLTAEYESFWICESVSREGSVVIW